MITNDYGHLVPDPRLTASEQRIDEIETRLIEGDKRMSRIEHDVAALYTSTQSINENTQDVVDLLLAAKGAFKVLNWIAAVAKPVTLIAVTCSTLYGLYVKFTGRGN